MEDSELFYRTRKPGWITCIQEPELFVLVLVHVCHELLISGKAGAFAALTIDLLVYPLDTIKTRIQAPDYKKLYTNPATGAAQRSLFRGLYQGIGSVVLATVPSCRLPALASRLS